MVGSIYICVCVCVDHQSWQVEYIDIWQVLSQTKEKKKLAGCLEQLLNLKKNDCWKEMIKAKENVTVGIKMTIGKKNDRWKD